MVKVVFIDDEEIACETVRDYLPNIETMLYRPGKFEVGALRSKVKEGIDYLICDGLKGDWKDIYNFMKREDVSGKTKFILASFDSGYVKAAKEMGLEAIDKDINFFVNLSKRFPEIT